MGSPLGFGASEPASCATLVGGRTRMATKKTPSPNVKPRASIKPKPAAPARLENLAARPSFADMEDEQLVDASGVFRVTTTLARGQRGQEEDATKRFPNDSLVMAAQREGFRDEGPTLDEAIDDHVVEDEATQALRRERLATLASRAQARTRPRR